MIKIRITYTRSGERETYLKVVETVMEALRSRGFKVSRSPEYEYGKGARRGKHRTRYSRCSGGRIYITVKP